MLGKVLVASVWVEILVSNGNEGMPGKKKTLQYFSSKCSGQMRERERQKHRFGRDFAKAGALIKWLA